MLHDLLSAASNSSNPTALIISILGLLGIASLVAWIATNAYRSWLSIRILVAMAPRIEQSMTAILGTEGGQGVRAVKPLVEIVDDLGGSIEHLATQVSSLDQTLKEVENRSINAETAAKDAKAAAIQAASDAAKLLPPARG